MELLVPGKICETCGSSVDFDMPSGFCPACLLTTALELSETTAAGSRIEDYELLSEVARGGMGIVYRARQRVPSRIVALKMILPTHLNSPGVVSRFRAEAEAAASLDHEGILPIYAVGEHDGAPFYSMKFAGGGTLADRLGQYRDKLRDAAALVAALARAVGYAHERGILHRDLKPGNVLFDSAGKAFVSDFGIAKWLQRECDLTQTLAILGTPYYMAPEQATDSRGVTAAADVYSLGSTLYHLLAGRPPIWGETPMEVLHRAATEQPKSPRLTNARISRDLETICLKCLEKEPGARYVSAAALADDLERFCAGRAIRARRTGLLTRSGKWMRRNPTGALLAAALIALAAAVGWNIWKSELIRGPVTTGIAVLPFENLSPDPDNAYFADGIQDEILTRLSKIAELKVISRNSTQRYKSAPTNLPEIARQLGVTHIVEGSVQKSGDAVRVNVQLIKAANDSHLWSDTFDRKLTDIFAVEGDIATTIAETLQAKLTGSEKTAIAKRPTANTEAYELYLKGRFFWNKRTGADLRTAIEYFNQALGKDPRYALAYAGLADSYGVLEVYGAASPADSFPQARAAAKKALELDDTLAEAHTSLAKVLGDYDFDLEQSLKEYERAIQLNPNYATAHQWLSNGPLLALGQFDRAIAEGKRAVELDPLSLVIKGSLGEYYFVARRYDQAIAQLRKTIEMDPRFYLAHADLGQAWQLKGHLNEAIAEYRKAVELNNDPGPLGLLGQAYARTGQREEAQKILARLSEEAKSRYVHAYSFALIYLALGDKERAIDELERAYRERAGNDIAPINVDPMLDDLRGNPRFEALMQKVLASKKAEADSQQSLP